MCISLCGRGFFSKRVLDTLCPTAARSEQGMMRSWSRPKAKRGRGMSAEAPQSVQSGHKAARKLSLTFPSQLRPTSCSEQKVRGQEREDSGVYFLVSMVLGELHQVWSVGGCWDELPGATAPLVLLGIFIRMTSFSAARFRPFPSSLTFHGPSRSRTLVTSLGPQTPGPSAPGPFSGSPMVLHVSSLVIPTL